MKIGVFSDSHGNMTVLRQAAMACIDRHHVDALVHLGDDSTDADELAHLGPELICVPGVFEDRYQDKSIPNRLIHEFQGVPFLITHTVTRDRHDLEGDIDPTALVRDGDVKAVLYGHTHMYKLGKEYDVVFINPGHLKPDDNRGNQPSYAVVEIDPKKIRAQIIDLKGEVLEDKTFFLEY